MDNQDNLFNKIKSAAENAETKDFPSMEKVWSRIDAKLDTKVEKKHNNNWKKLLVAASILLVVTIGYQFLKTEKEIVTPNNEIVTKEVEKPIIQDSLENQNTIVSSEIENPNIKENADEILKKQVAKPDVVASSEAVEENNKVANAPKTDINNSASSNSDGVWYGNRNFESRGVQYQEAKKVVLDEETKKEKSDKKLDPIIIVDGKATNKTMSDLNDENIESIIELPNPIYYINSILYTEEELFGPNPTSPYAPLNKQKIESTTVLHPEKAVKIYGEKGKNGVVIITTKDGKPVKKKE
jgi:hypothetical protein